MAEGARALLLLSMASALVGGTLAALVGMVMSTLQAIAVRRLDPRAVARGPHVAAIRLPLRREPRFVAGEVVEELAVKIGEKIELGRVAYFEGPTVTYMHRRAADLPPAVGVLVEYDGDNEDAARAAAMQVAAMRPTYVSRDEVPSDIVEKEREIVLAQTLQTMQGKPQQVIDKAVEGRMEKFFAEKCLLETAYVDPTGQGDALTVEQRRHQLVGKIGENIVIRRFVRMDLGG